MAGHNKNTYRILAINQFTENLKSGEHFHIRECVNFLNTRKASGTNRPHKQTQTKASQLAMLLKRTGMFTSLGKGEWRFDGASFKGMKK
jgi:hypothetical protein